MSNETILSIANAVEARDKRTGRHSFRVAVYSMLIAAELGFDDEELENIRQIGLLHDIGKIGVRIFGIYKWRTRYQATIG